MRPKRLFGFDGTAGEDPRSPTGLASLRSHGLPPATAVPIIAQAAMFKLQGRNASVDALRVRGTFGIPCFWLSPSPQPSPAQAGRGSGLLPWPEPNLNSSRPKVSIHRRT